MNSGQREALPADSNWLTPYLTVNDAGRSIAFYERAFGFERAEVLTDKSGRIIHAGMKWQGRSIVMFAPEGADPSMPMRTPAHLNLEMPVSFYVYCGDVDSLTARAREAGATILSPPEDMFWGDRVARMADPDGYIWVLATRAGEFDAQKAAEMELSPVA